MSKTPYPTTIYIVRHAESQGNVQTDEGRSKLPVGTNYYKLTKRGRIQAKAVHDLFQGVELDPYRVFVSYYARTNETAQIVFPDAEYREDSLLAERSRGVWDTMTLSDMEAHMPWEVERKRRQGEYHYRPAAGENFPDVERRVREFVRSLKEKYDGKEIVVVTHSHWILLWQKIFHGWSIEETVRRFENRLWVDNASVLVYHNIWDSSCNQFVLHHLPEKDHIVPWKLHLVEA